MVVLTGAGPVAGVLPRTVRRTLSAGGPRREKPLVRTASAAITVVLLDTFCARVPTGGGIGQVIGLACSGAVTGVLPGAIGFFVTTWGLVGDKTVVVALPFSIAIILVDARCARISAGDGRREVIGQARPGAVAGVLR